MKLLPDESIPRRLAEHFPAAMEVRTVPQMGWAGMKNGKLLAIAATEGFTALVKLIGELNTSTTLRHCPCQ